SPGNWLPPYIVSLGPLRLPLKSCSLCWDSILRGMKRIQDIMQLTCVFLSQCRSGCEVNLADIIRKLPVTLCESLDPLGECLGVLLFFLKLIVIVASHCSHEIRHTGRPILAIGGFGEARDVFVELHPLRCQPILILGNVILETAT